jgi:uncharacterized protein involved in exopolysaccharide biosynthesis
MRQRIVIGAWILSLLLLPALTALAQIPGGVQVPGTGSVPGMPSTPAMPTVPSKDSLLQQVQGMVTDLTALKSNGKLAPAQVQQVDGLLPKATAVTSGLQQPQVPTSKLAEYATTLKDLQQQVAALTGLVK